MVSVFSMGSHISEDGPTVNECSVWRSALRPRSVIVNRPPGPYVATFMQTLFCGSRRPDHLYHGEKTDPINAITEIARPEFGSTPSTYHHAYPFGGTSMLKFGAFSSPRPRARRKESPLESLPLDEPRPRP